MRCGRNFTVFVIGGWSFHCILTACFFVCAHNAPEFIARRNYDKEHVSQWSLKLTNCQTY